MNLLAFGFLLSTNAACYSQDWQVIDSVVQIYEADDTKDSLDQGIVVKVHDGKAFVLKLRTYRFNEDTVLSETSKLVGSPCAILVRGGTPGAKFVPAEKRYSKIQTGNQEIYVADADKMPPPARFTDSSKLRDGDTVQLAAFVNHVVDNQWVTDRRDRELKYTEDKKNESNYFVCQGGSYTSGIAYDPDEGILGRFRQGQFRKRPKGGVSSWSKIAAEHDSWRYIVSKKNYRDVAYDGKIAKVQFYVGICPISDSPKSIQVEYARRAYGGKRDFEKTPPKKELRKLPREEWSGLEYVPRGIVRRANGPGGQPKAESLPSPKVYPFSEVWAVTVEIPEAYVPVNWPRMELNYRFTVDGVPQHTASASFLPQLNEPNSFRGVELAKDAKARLEITGPGTVVDEVSRLNEPCTLRFRASEPRSLLTDSGQRGIFRFSKFKLPNEKLVQPILFDKTESRAILGTERGLIVIADTKKWKTTGAEFFVSLGIQSMAISGSSLYVLTADETRVLKISLAQRKILKEIALPRRFPTLESSQQSQLLFHPNLKGIGFVARGNELVVLDLKKSSALQWLRVGNARGVDHKLRNVPYAFRFADAGRKLLFRGANGVYRVSFDATGKVYLEDKLPTNCLTTTIASASRSPYFLYGLAEHTYEKGSIRMASTRDFTKTKEFAPTDKEMYWRGFAFDDQNKHLFAYVTPRTKVEGIGILKQGGKQLSTIELDDDVRAWGDLRFLPVTRRLMTALDKSDGKEFTLHTVPSSLQKSRGLAASEKEEISWKGETQETKRGDITWLASKLDEVVWPPLWLRRDSNHVFFGDKSGNLYKLRLSDLTLTNKLVLPSGCGPIVPYMGAGLVVANPRRNMVLHLDRDLNVVRTFDVDSPDHILAATESPQSFVVASTRSTKSSSDRRRSSTGSNSVKRFSCYDQNGLKWTQDVAALDSFLPSNPRTGKEVDRDELKQALKGITNVNLSPFGTELVTMGESVCLFQVKEKGLEFFTTPINATPHRVFAAGRSEFAIHVAGEEELARFWYRDAKQLKPVNIPAPDLSWLDYSRGRSRYLAAHGEKVIVFNEKGKVESEFEFGPAKSKSNPIVASFSASGRHILVRHNGKLAVVSLRKK